MARFAKRVLSIEPSATVRISDLITDLKARGEKILSLAIGEPDFPTPAHIIDGAKKALDEGFTKYTPASGIRELREAIAEKSQKENRIPAKPENVLVAPTKHTLFMTCMALLDSGDEAIIPDPGWVSYAPMVTLAGARPVPLRAADEDGFVPTPDAVSEAITPRTRLLMINSPSNPAGSVYSRDEIKALAALRGPTAPLQAMVKEFRARRDLVLKELATVEGLSTHRPTGAFYVFPRYDAKVDSATLSERILKEASVAVTPGSAFGEAGEGHLRISYAASRETIAEGLGRIREVFAHL